MAYAWLLRMGGGPLSSSWYGGKGGGAPVYDYGWPSGGTSESNVTAQWLFDETVAASDIVDEVGAVALVETKTGVPTITRDVDNSDYGNNLNPGILFSGTTGHRGCFYKVGTNGLDFGTGDGTVEWVASYLAAGSQVAGQSNWTPLSTVDNSINDGIYFNYSTISTTPKFTMWIAANDGTKITTAITLTTDPFDNVTHKHRVVMDRSGNAEYFIDGTSQGTVSMATLVGKTIGDAQAVVNGVLSSCVNIINMTMYELRFSQNATNNSGGPNGG